MRIIIYCVAIINIVIGLVLLYRRPAPFGKKGLIKYTYENYEEDHKDKYGHHYR